MIPEIDAQLLFEQDPATLAKVRDAAQTVGFMTLHNTGLSAQQVDTVIDQYRMFFRLPDTAKARIDMAKTGSNRGWGGAGSEQVDPDANPDYKQVFDCGVEVPAEDARAKVQFYAPNQWPDLPLGFQETIEAYFVQARSISMRVLSGIARAIGQDAAFFDDKFDTPMALLRGNYYPERPAWAGAKDFGIATHTDYGCLTFLATDGQPGLEVRKRGGGWIPVQAQPGTFIINFGEMLEMWTNGAVKATPHRVVGGAFERISVPLFFNPNDDTNVAPLGSGKVIRAGDHLSARYNETYVHLQTH
ncbi:isopenicillin N synthase family oxygenase [Nereida sp. MMG025]|uniref:isopenicillin N synthase family dioxygenase n=1 Tax=Nereida sp. MMG025 TaxID=2909981 RepID=UPI001F2CF2BF|nr:2-oxoglutarate and iron-dependent oxygenase domain-containing protein [Nereida sp. MMG025]MCF6445376.1 isopenicillin N synthase family oxygenase [Nereida sp. MMG025]